MSDVDIRYLVRGLIGYSSAATGQQEYKISEVTGRDVEDVALDFNVEKCNDCGFWVESCELEDGVCDSCR